MAKKKGKCTDCGKVTDDLYWVDVNGKKTNKPRCSECHQDAVRRDASGIDQPRAMSYQQQINKWKNP